jgi:hypothetical protein
MKTDFMRYTSKVPSLKILFTKRRNFNMRKEMREAILKEQRDEMLSQRNESADRLFEKWSKKTGIGENMDKIMEKDVNKARALSIILENQENHLGKLTETQISNSFATTPENVMRIVRLGYPNSVRGDLFLEWAMETARDSIYYLSPVYQASKRGATAGGVMHESPAFRYGSEIEVDTVGTGDGSTVAFDNTLLNAPIRPYTVRLLVDDVPIATDDGAGNLSGALLNSSGTNTINYTTGEYTVTFTAAPASGGLISLEYHYDSEVSNNYTDIGSVELQLRDYQFRVKPWPLYVSWSKMTEVLVNTTLNIDAEDALIRGAADEFKKSLDFHAIRLAYQSAKGHAPVTFNVQGAVGEPEIDRMTAFNKAIDQASDLIYNSLQRGGVTKLVGGPGAITQIKLHRRFDVSSRQPKVGAYREGTLDGIDVYKVPASIVPNDEIMAIYKNELVPEDVSVSFGSLIPLYQTQTLEFKEMYKETGLAYFGDAKVLQPNYLQRIKLTNI